MSNTPNPKRSKTINMHQAGQQYATTGARLDYEQAARDLAMSVLTLAAALRDWDGEGVGPSDVLNGMIPLACAIVDSPAEQKIIIPS